MERRKFIQVAGATAAVSFLMGQSSFADDSTAPVEQGETETLVINHSIARNHGHLLVLTPITVIKLLRQLHLQKDSVADVSIKGTSAHDHLLRFDEAALVKLLAEREIILASSNVGGHTHDVTIQLDIFIEKEESTNLG